MLKKAIGARIQVLRLKRKLSQFELAKIADVHRSYLAGVETGERNITLESLDKIILALDVSYEYFFSELSFKVV